MPVKPIDKGITIHPTEPFSVGSFVKRDPWNFDGDKLKDFGIVLNVTNDISINNYLIYWFIEMKTETFYSNYFLIPWTEMNARLNMRESYKEKKEEENV